MASLQQAQYQRNQRKKFPEKIAEIEKKSKLKAREADPVKFIYWAAKTKCKKRNIEFTITRNDLVLPERCPLLDIPLFIGNGIRGPNSPSLDRIDPTKGYTRDNVWIISWRANDLKKNASLNELEKLVTNLKLKMGGFLG